ncbi:unnamed protein product, partial [Scytosiphon promiscuus]
MGGGGGGGGGGSGGGSSADKSSHGRDWVRHELCGKLVSNLFSSKTLRERLSKKPVAGILVGLLCGPPARWINSKTNSAGTSRSSSNNTTPASSTRPGKLGGDSGNNSAGTGKRAASASSEHRGNKHQRRPGSKQHEEEIAPAPKPPLPEGCGDPRPLLYGGGDEAAAIGSRFLCEVSILYSAEGGFELPQRTLEALVKIAHFYNYKAAATSEPWKSSTTLMPGGTSGSGAGEGFPLKEANDSRAVRGYDESPGHPTSDVGKDRSGARTGSPPESSASAVAADDERNRQESSPREGRGPSGSAADGAVPAAGATATTEAGEAEDEGATRPSATPRTKPQDDHHQAQQPPVGDDWYTGAGERFSNSPTQLAGIQDAWSKTAREITRLWVRAIGWLCCPSHSELWPHMIDVGVIGALNTCLSSSALSGDEEGLAICAAALRNLSTATSPRSLSGERAAACFGAAKRLLSCGQPQVQIDCAAAMVNFVDATHVQDLQTLDVVGLLGEHCGWEDQGRSSMDSSSSPAATTVGELAVYSLSKLCTRDFVPKGDRVIATITTMMDFDAQAMKRLEDHVRQLVNPPLPPRGPWKFLHPSEALGAMALPGLAKRAQDESGEELDLANGPPFTMQEHHGGLRRGDTSNALPRSATAGDGEVAGGGGGAAAGAAGGTEDGSHDDATTPLSAAHLPDGNRESPAAAATASANSAGPGGKETSRTGHGGGHTLRATVAKLANVISETSMAARAFGSKQDGPVNVQSRILRSPILAAEEPPFELPWLLKHGKADRLRLLEESLDGTPAHRSRIRRPDPKAPLPPKDVGAGGKDSSAGGKEDTPQAEGVGGEGKEREVSDEEAFEILTVPDDKWISPDLPPEAGKQQQDN